ncbi:MAG: glycosyltransferase [Parcubacteria group bacterium]|jgi:GT2 family glycosyltransferase
MNEKIENKKIDIIIPVYNGLEFLPRLFESLFDGTTAPYRLILVDDCSLDERVYPYLEKIKKDHPDKDILLLKNEKNLGFVQTVNFAVKETRHHFVLVNTDVEVPAGWLERLMQPILSGEKVASVTPFTNSGTICSFPNFVQDNEIFMGLSVSEIDSYFQKVKTEKKYVELPTGVGFCMAFNQDVVKAIGMFDEGSFGKGYGEENDWCQRAIKKGYRNVIAPNLFVYHKHGGSFPSDEKKRLMEDNFKKLLKKHPKYAKDVEFFIHRDAMKPIRDFLIILISASQLDKKPILFFDHELGGGANLYTKKIVEKRIKDGEKTFVCSYDFRNDSYHLKYYYQQWVVKYSFDRMEELQDFLDFVNLEKIIVSQLVSYSRPLEIISHIIEMKTKKQCALDILVHDYFSVCPNYVLVNEQDEFCGVPNVDKCKQCMSRNKNDFRQYVADSDVETWRSAWENLLDFADDIICFSQASKDIFIKAYPQLKKEKIIIRPHSIDGELLRTIKKNKNTESVLTIGVLGGINKIKGSEIIKEMGIIIEKNNLPVKIVVIGEFIEKKYSHRIQVHGKYAHDDLPEIINSYGMDIFLIPSIWPETFSYTTQEIMQMDYPLAVFDLGAPAERVKKYAKGLIIEEIDAQVALDGIINYCKKNEK